MQDYVNIRMDDIRQFSAITDRFDINNLEEYNLNSSII
jgi:hypothetical protein